VSAVIARFASAQKKERIKLSKEFPKNSPSKMAIGMEQLENALYVSKILAYAQGYELLNAASKKYAWNLNFQEISRIWEGGCIIRASFLKELEEAFAKDNNGSILTSLVFKKSIENGTSDLRLIASAAIMNSLPVPAFLSGIAYFDSMTNEFLCANMIQAQRDFFGAHTFQKEVDGDFFHHDWD
jgi:6-phosphogluconate dehydrogenase